MTILHKLAHVLGLNRGIPYSFWKGKKLMMSFKCGYCGKLDGIHDTGERQ
jgi:hypothetical protein